MLHANTAVVFRGYAKTREGVPEIVGRLAASVRRARELDFDSIIVAIPAESDCGRTASMVASALADVSHESQKCTVIVRAFPGDENSSVLNAAFSVARRCGATYGFIVSNKALPYLERQNVDKMIEALNEGAAAAGLAMRDVGKSLEDDEVFLGTLEGRIVNTCAVWDLGPLQSVGGFDSKIGVEEIAPIVRLAMDNESVAPVLPISEARLDVSEIRASHHHAVMSSKTVRQQQEAERAGGSFAAIRRAILPGYPR